MILMVQVFKNKVLLAPTTVPGGRGTYYRQGQAKDKLRVSGHCKEAGSYHSVVNNLKNQQLSSNSSEKQGHRLNCYPSP